MDYSLEKGKDKEEGMKSSERKAGLCGADTSEVNCRKKKGYFFICTQRLTQLSYGVQLLLLIVPQKINLKEEAMAG